MPETPDAPAILTYPAIQETWTFLYLRSRRCASVRIHCTATPREILRKFDLLSRQVRLFVPASAVFHVLFCAPSAGKFTCGAREIPGQKKSSQRVNTARRAAEGRNFSGRPCVTDSMLQDFPGHADCESLASILRSGSPVSASNCSTIESRSRETSQSSVRSLHA